MVFKQLSASYFSTDIVHRVVLNVPLSATTDARVGWRILKTDLFGTFQRHHRRTHHWLNKVMFKAHKRVKAPPPPIYSRLSSPLEVHHSLPFWFKKDADLNAANIARSIVAGSLSSRSRGSNDGRGKNFTFPQRLDCLWYSHRLLFSGYKGVLSWGEGWSWLITST
jgi:hypothetical protein